MKTAEQIKSMTAEELAAWHQVLDGMCDVIEQARLPFRTQKEAFTARHNFYRVTNRFQDVRKSGSRWVVCS